MTTKEFVQLRAIWAAMVASLVMYAGITWNLVFKEKETLLVSEVIKQSSFIPFIVVAAGLIGLGFWMPHFIKGKKSSELVAHVVSWGFFEGAAVLGVVQAIQSKNFAVFLIFAVPASYALYRKRPLHPNPSV